MRGYCRRGWSFESAYASRCWRRAARRRCWPTIWSRLRLEAAAALARERRAAILAANQADCEAGADKLDEGMLDRLRLDEARVEALARRLEATAASPPLERELGSWTRANGLRVSERRVPIGTVGANFEARPNVALDVAGQLLKSLNAAVLRTGAAALRTVWASLTPARRSSC